MASLRFVYGVTTVTLARSVRPEQNSSARQETSSSAAGRVFALEPIKIDHEYTLALTGLSISERAALVAFFVLVGIGTNFTMIDHHNRSRTVQFVSDTIVTAEKAPGRYTTTITLLEV